jgi:hypothetical protein
LIKIFFIFFRKLPPAFYKLKRMMLLQPSVLLAESIFAASLSGAAS